MSKKRKTRKQKEQASVRHQEQIVHIHPEPAVYSVVSPTKKSEKKTPVASIPKADTEYLKLDIVHIASASGIVVAIEILLFVLLTSGTLRLNFLGY